MRLLRCSEWFLCCYVVATVFWVVLMLLCGCYGVLSGSYVAMWLLGCSGWFLCCYVVARVFWMFFSLLLCGIWFKYEIMIMSTCIHWVCTLQAEDLLSQSIDDILEGRLISDAEEGSSGSVAMNLISLRKASGLIRRGYSSQEPGTELEYLNYVHLFDLCTCLNTTQESESHDRWRRVNPKNTSGGFYWKEALTHRNTVQGDIILLAFLHDFPQVWAVVRFSISDDNHDFLGIWATSVFECLCSVINTYTKTCTCRAGWVTYKL